MIGIGMNEIFLGIYFIFKFYSFFELIVGGMFFIDIKFCDSYYLFSLLRVEMGD